MKGKRHFCGSSNGRCNYSSAWCKCNDINRYLIFCVLTFYLKMYIFGSRGSKTYHVGLRLIIQIILLKALNKEFWFYPVRNEIYFGVDF